MKVPFAFIGAALAMAAPVFADPIALVICLVGCKTVAAACHAAAGFTFGTIAAPVAPAVIVACNTALGTCSAACAGI